MNFGGLFQVVQILIQFTNLPGIDKMGPQLSWDGSKIVFYAGLKGIIYTIDANGLNLQQITYQTEGVSRGDASWSPDGKSIVYVETMIDPSDQSAVQTISITNLVDHTTKQIYQAKHAVINPVFSPDGKQILYSAGNLYTVSTSGGPIKQLTSAKENGFFTCQSWSPNGKSTLYISQQGYDSVNKVTIGDNNLYVMNADGTGIINITNNSISRIVAAQWSPDSEKITFESYPNPDANTENLYVVNADGTELSLLKDIDLTKYSQQLTAVVPTSTP